MATIDEVLIALAELHADLDAGVWEPDAQERQLAVLVQAAGGASPEAVRTGLRTVGPDGVDGRLAPVAANCAALLDGLSTAGPDDKDRVRGAFAELLDRVALTGLHS